MVQLKAWNVMETFLLGNPPPQFWGLGLMAYFKVIVFGLKNWGRQLSPLFLHFHDIFLARLGGLELHTSTPTLEAFMLISATPQHLLYNHAQKKQIFHSVLCVCIRKCRMIPTFTYVKEAKLVSIIPAEREEVSSCLIRTEGLLQSRLTESLERPVCLFHNLSVTQIECSCKSDIC